VAHTCNPSYSGGRDQENCSSRSDQAKRKALSQKHPTPTKKKWVGGVVECEALSSNPSITKSQLKNQET
jgi:hypothetical protein